MTVAMDLPTPVKTVVDGLVASAQEAFGAGLRSVILYGSAAEGRLRPTSDVNLLLILDRFDRGVDRFREPFRFAQAAANVNAMFLLEHELPEAAIAFAQKFDDIAHRHAVLHGEDLVANLTIPRDALVRRVRQILLNLTIRLREMYVVRSLREEQCAVTVAETAGPLRTSASAILELEGAGRIAPKEALARVVEELRQPALSELLPHLSEAREQRALPAGQGANVLFHTLELARALHDRAMRIGA
jgi:predicted nucleotidyltransferase